MSVLFAATYPERTRALALYGAFPCGTYDDELPADLREPAERLTAEMFGVVEHWGEGLDLGRQDAPGTSASSSAPRPARRWRAEWSRWGSSWTCGRRSAAVHVPTVVVHRSGDPFPVGVARWMAGRIPGARFVELPGDMHPLWRGDMDAVVDEVEALVTGAPSAAATGRGRSSRSCASTGGPVPDRCVDQQLERFGGRRMRRRRQRARRLRRAGPGDPLRARAS